MALSNAIPSVVAMLAAHAAPLRTLFAQATAGPEALAAAFLFLFIFFSFTAGVQTGWWSWVRL